ncbi:conserved hypothetical protein [Rippkaea orientalis PCC 8801]|uniref:Uncharacterized protein n=1 Tax=Rippkaea orientalis (strain PCC 8801 / RF-1) TaxID=41431 RepID=B7K0N7_RIPO1|nr:hypothetical protein [Rippkaea orientalis]ACK64191.1 conserved hypothetical protein [Rippkaea orientalis PCC 8801]
MDKLYNYHHNKAELTTQIMRRKNIIKVPKDLAKNLVDTYQLCRVLDDYLYDYFPDSLPKQISLNIHDEIDKIMAIFKDEVLQGLGQEKQKFRQISRTSNKRFKNIFEFSGSENLYLSNIYTRFISENLGHKFEDIANLSNQVYIPNQELGIKLKGVDLIIYDQGVIKYTQLKTKKDTLTGSQKDRSIEELKIHPYSIFAAALDMGSSWTISSKSVQNYNIELMAGHSFWSLINLEYHLILDKVAKTINELDKELYS